MSDNNMETTEAVCFSVCLRRPGAVLSPLAARACLLLHVCVQRLGKADVGNTSRRGQFGKEDEDTQTRPLNNDRQKTDDETKLAAGEGDG